MIGLRRLFPRKRARYTITPLSVQQSAVSPFAFKEISRGEYFIDFGRTAFAALELVFPRPEPGRIVSVRLGEARKAPYLIDSAAGVSVRYHEAKVVLKKGQQTYVVQLTKEDARWMPATIGPVMPFRFVEITNAPAAMKPEHVRQIMVHYPFDDSAAHFACPDPRLNSIWELCKYTMKATSFAGIFVDGDRERKPYEADAYINQLGWYYCAGEYALPRYSHEYLIRHPTWPTEWLMFSVLMAWEDYLYSGETASLREFYNDLTAKTLLALARPDGLIQPPARALPLRLRRAIHIRKIRNIADWPIGDRDGYEMVPVSTVANAFHVRALNRMSRIAGALGKVEDAKNFHAASEKAARSLNEKLFDPATGLYVDGEGSRHSSLHANMFPLAFGVVPLEQRPKVIEFVRSRGMACSVYGAQFLLDALFESGQAAHALALMTAPGDRSWRHMVEDLGATITLEDWDNKYKPKQDWNHAWGAAPANILPRQLMGVAPLEAGFSKVLIRPRPGLLAWAESRTPTPRGPIIVRFDNNENFQLRIETPEGITAQVALPLVSGDVARHGGELIVDGTVVKGIESEESVFVDNLPGGRHEIVLRKSRCRNPV
jgi:hypothetical protein